MKLGISVLLLLFFTAITTSYLLYPWLTSLIQRMQSFPNNILYFDPANTSLNSTYITLSVRNLGNNEVTVTAANINHQPYTQALNHAIPPQTTSTIYLYGDFEHGKQYKVELICSNGYSQTYTING